MSKNLFFKTLMLKGEAGGTITSIEKIASQGGAYVFRIHLSDGSYEDFSVNEVVDNEIVNQLIDAAAPGIVSQAVTQADADLESAINRIFPVGSVFITTVNTNPGTFIGGTWASLGAGRTLVGVDTSDTDFNTPKKTGGEKEHTLTTSEIPEHNHAHAHNVGYSSTSPLTDSRIYSGHVDDPEGTDHYVLTAANGQGGDGILDIQKTSAVGNPLTTWDDNTSAGGGQAHNNVQPYITVYFWERTA